MLLPNDDLPVIKYEKHRISFNEDENTFYFHRSEVPEFKERNYLMFKDEAKGIAATFELRVEEEDGWIYYAIGDSGLKKPCRLLILR